MSAITNLEPRIVWEQFDAITRVPRPSKKEGRIIEFLVDFARKHNLEYKKDAIGNVVMRKPATPGFENRPTVILQSHMDMVCEKNSDVEFDFDRDPIRTRIDGGWVRAEGTTLGADCGIGMAAALAVLIDPSVEHGPVEALFTVDEETGLTGAFEPMRSSAFRSGSRMSSSSTINFSPPISKPSSVCANPTSRSRSTKCRRSIGCSTPGRSSDWSIRWWACPTA